MTSITHLHSRRELHASIANSQGAASSDPDALLQLPTVIALTGIGRTSIYNRIKAGQFPAPIRLSQRCARWRAGEVRAWLKAQGAAA